MTRIKYKNKKRIKSIVKKAKRRICEGENK
jgi:hypothetical protein